MILTGEYLTVATNWRVEKGMIDTPVINGAIRLSTGNRSRRTAQARLPSPVRLYREGTSTAECTDVVVSVMVCRPTGTSTKGPVGSPSSPAGPNAPRGAVAIGTNSSSRPTSRECWQVQQPPNLMRPTTDQHEFGSRGRRYGRPKSG